MKQKISTLIESGMPPQQARVYGRREIEGMSRQETAEDMKISPNTVDTHLAKAKAHMTNAVQLTRFAESEFGGVFEWIEQLEETDHPDSDKTDDEEFKEYWKNYPPVPGGR